MLEVRGLTFADFIIDLMSELVRNGLVIKGCDIRDGSETVGAVVWYSE